MDKFLWNMFWAVTSKYSEQFKTILLTLNSNLRVILIMSMNSKAVSALSKLIEFLHSYTDDY